MSYTDFQQVPIILNVSQLAQVLGIGINNTYELIHSGRIDAVKIGRQYRISKDAVLKFLGISAA